MASRSRVYKAYEEIADWFDLVRMRDITYEKPYLEIVASNIKAAGRVLDIGCGVGEPIAKYFANQRFEVIGIDGSLNMVKKARSYVPNATFYVCDMRKLALNERFDAIILWHSLFHLPAADQKNMFPIFEQHLTPGGILLFTSGSSESEEWSDNGGQDLYHASLLPETYKALLGKHNFELLAYKLNDAHCSGATIWVAKYAGNTA